MLVQNTFRISRRPTGVAEAAGLALISLVPAIVPVLGSKKFIKLVVKANEAARSAEFRSKSFDDRGKGAIVEDDTVLGVVDDISQLVIEQPRIKRVENAAHADDAEPRYQVPVVIHCQRCDTFSGPHPESLESLGELPRSSGNLDPVGADSHAVGARRDDLARAVLAFGMVHQPHDAERKVLHCAERAQKRLPRGAHHDSKTSDRIQLEGQL